MDDYSILVAVHYSCISSGTEVATIENANSNFFSNVPYKIKKVLDSVVNHGIDGTKSLIKNKLLGQFQSLGYSVSGRVIAIGSHVKNFTVGDYVACAGAGFANHADIVCVPEHLSAKISEKKYLKYGSLTTIGAIALQGIRRAQLELGQHVCVIGLGLLGQITVQLAKQSGAQVIGIDILEDRLKLAQNLGADHVFNAHNENIYKEIEFLTNHHGVDSTLITAASMSETIVQQAMEITRKKGKVVVIGDVPLSIKRDPFYKKEIDFLISCSYGPGRYDENYELRSQDYPLHYVRWTENRNMQTFVQLIERNALNLSELICQEVDLDDVATAYEQIKNRTSIGVILCYNPEKLDETQPIYKPAIVDLSQTMRFIPARKDSMRVGFIGAGGFAKVKLMPIISKLEKVKINAIVDADTTISLNASKLCGSSHAFTCEDQLWHEDLVDVVVIASPHKYHCDQGLKALSKGKAVFMEKPMVTDFEQFHKFEQFLKEHPQVPFCVDYNRSFSPYVQKIKSVIEKRHTPLMISYRMNAGFISKEHWIQTDIGAGRIIGEACHIVDLFCYLVNAKPIAVSVEALHTGTDDIFPTDNFSTQLRFEDGSVCTLLYTSLGHASMGKERMEIFFDSKSIIMQDFAQLHGFGLPNTFNETTLLPKKGHEELLTLFFQEIRKPTFTPLISVDRLNLVAQLTLIIDSLACEGGGVKELQ